MKPALAILSTLALLGCSEENGQLLQPPIQDPETPIPEASPVSLWGMVVDGSGVCIVGASVTVVGGQGLGQSIEQTTPCNAWAYDGGFVFRNLTPGVAMTLRATAVGYADEELTVIPSLGPQRSFLVAPSRLP